MSKLSAKMKRFCEEYLIDLNASAAARRAGYSEKTAFRAGQVNMQKYAIQAEIQKAIKERTRRTRIDADYVLTSIKTVAERCMQAEPVMIKGEDGKMIESGEFKFDSSGANRALELLGKHLRLFTDKMELAGKDGEPISHEWTVNIVGVEDAKDKTALEINGGVSTCVDE